MKRHKGFTLVELLVATLVGAVVLSGVFASYQYIQGQYTRLSTQAELQSTGRDVVNFVRRDLSMAGYTHRDSSGAFELGVITESPLAIDSDKKGFAVVYDYQDPSTAVVQRQRVRYSLSAYTSSNGDRFRLMRQVDVLSPLASTGVPTILADYLEDFFIFQGESDVSSTMVACYGFNNNLIDAVAAQNATGSGAITYVNGVAGSALSLDGSSDASVSSVSNLSFSDTFTVSFFVKPGDAVISDRVAVISKGANDYAMFIDKDHKVYVTQSAADGTAMPILSSGAALPTDRFSHVAMVRDSASWRVYVNATPWELAVGAAGKVTGDPLYIGKDGTASYPNFQGALDDVRFYGRALSAAEVASLATNAYQDCGASGSSLVNVAFVVRSPKGVGRTRTFTSNSFTPGSATYVPTVDNYLREAFTLAIHPQNL